LNPWSKLTWPILRDLLGPIPRFLPRFLGLRWYFLLSQTSMFPKTLWAAAKSVTYVHKFSPFCRSFFTRLDSSCHFITNNEIRIFYRHCLDSFRFGYLIFIWKNIPVFPWFFDQPHIICYISFFLCQSVSYFCMSISFRRRKSRSLNHNVNFAIRWEKYGCISSPW